MHVFIEAGLRYRSRSYKGPAQTNVLEMGFGTGRTVQRAMQAAGFRIEKLVGPMGKREIVRAHLNPPEGRTSLRTRPA